MVNDEPAYYGEAPGRFVGMDIVEPMYLGGVPNYAEIPRAAGFNQGFVGKYRATPSPLGRAYSLLSSEYDCSSHLHAQLWLS